MPTFADLDELTAPDGARLVLRREPAAAPFRASLILAHGWGEHAGRYSHVAAWLAGRGISVYAIDQRGAGRSPGPRGHIARFAQYVADLVALRRVVETESPGPLLLLGHSHGGLITLRYLESAPTGVAGAIVMAPWLSLAFTPPRWKLLLARALADVVPGVPIPTGVNLDDLCTDPAVVAAVREDPYYSQVMSPRAYRETLAAQAHALDERRRIAVPLFIGLGGDDRLVSTPAAQSFASGLLGDVTVRVYDGFYHEILNERERERVFGDLDAWLDRILASPAAA